MKWKFKLLKRRAFKVHGKQLFGYFLLISKLTTEQSIVSQQQSLGGRRKLRGVFFELGRPKNAI